MSSYRHQQHIGNTSPVLNERYQVTQIALLPNDRDVLHQRIAKRFDAMLSLGFIDEVKSLFQRGDLTAELPSIRTVGYRQAWQYLSGENDYDTMVEKSIVATRQLAKRQLTWLRSWPNLNKITMELSSDNNDKNNEELQQVAEAVKKMVRFLPI